MIIHYMNIEFLKDLNPDQTAAVQNNQGPSIVLAGAGSGKTRVLTYKAMYILKVLKVLPENLLMLTFTNKAADEMKKRITKYIEPKYNPQKVKATTFHSFCAYLLRKYGTVNKVRDFAIYDGHDQQDLIKSIVKDSNLKVKLSPNAFLYKISEAKNQLLKPIDLEEKATNIFEEVVGVIYREYQKRLKEANALDFDDLLMETVKLLTQNKALLQALQNQYQYILIDEYQDTNHAQYLIAKLLSEQHQNITIVGDFSQSIYSWRGADFRNLEKFQTDYPKAKVFNLEQNYRSTQPILDFAFSIISQNTSHPILKLWTKKKQGEEIQIVPLQNAEQEALYVINKVQELNFNGDCSLKDMVVLYRTNAQSRLFEEICLSNGLPYKIYGGIRFYERKEIKDVLAFVKYLINPKDKVALKRIEKLGKQRGKNIIAEILKQNRENKPQAVLQNLLQNSPYLEIYSETDPEDNTRLENVKELVNVAYNFKTLPEFLDTVALIEAGYNFENSDIDKLSLMTLHAVKGLEYAVVFIVGVEEGILPHSRSTNSLEELEEERRLFYVGSTRAKQLLYITYAQERRVYGQRQYNLPSQFLTEANKN